MKKLLSGPPEITRVKMFAAQQKCCFSFSLGYGYGIRLKMRLSQSIKMNTQFLPSVVYPFPFILHLVRRVLDWKNLQDILNYFFFFLLTGEALMLSKIQCWLAFILVYFDRPKAKCVFDHECAERAACLMSACPTKRCHDKEWSLRGYTGQGTEPLHVCKGILTEPGLPYLGVNFS